MYYYQVFVNLPLSQSFTYMAEHMLAIGTRVEVNFGNKKKIAVVESETQGKDIEKLKKNKVNIKKILKVVDKEPLLNVEQFTLARWMSEYYLTPFGQCVFTMMPSSKREKDHTITRDIISEFTLGTPRLTIEQESCVNTLIKAAFEKKGELFYLYGLTGSGKTEVFLQTIKKLIEKSTQVLYLVPEISLSYQLYPLLCSRFGKEKVAIFHSGLTASQRLKEWNRIKNGEALVILGARSVVFAPVKNLGFIVIDEEHDTSYKSDVAPRYNAKQVALKRSKLANVPLLMASATPSLETWNYVLQKKCTLLKLTKRVAGGELPKIELASLHNTQGCISGLLQNQMSKTLREKNQVLLLLNKRGFSHSFVCNSCGYIASCPNCSVNLVLHKTKENDVLLCHHCGYKTSKFEKCPKCDYIVFGVKGWGTQRVESEVTKLFPHHVVERFDSDVTRERKNAHQVLKGFYEKKIDILIGTQMIAKGVNFPHLQLVGILCVDTLFALPDFRSSERAYNLLTQAAGRAGRFLKEGRVVIQTYSEKHPSLEYLKVGRHEVFYKKELERRREFSLSPHRRMFRLVFRGKNESDVHHYTHEFFVLLSKRVTDIDCTILGPAPCVLHKVAKNYRTHIILSSPSQQKLITLVKNTLSASTIKQSMSTKKVYLEIDPDPQSVM